MATKGTVVFDHDVCKGCGLCVTACGVHVLELDEQSINAMGYHPVRLTDPETCNGCANCAVMCPDQSITVSKEKRTDA
ncbi:Ion-translocating oxidoreductase complex subunit B [Austwickia sp. TVS 96-490-7B]|uniref:4Fe-4S dicluster domain-containing protein n=1 Tax=Austwickia sp. TVS 96-490-7B TaxID=2830843 RepID=UPI001C5595C2|nr:4Fe-4S dicluster domain-containing protein [Austwickia sp. TVS 96-490-7B]MBW3086945.1 Ion-translocating oxidoreductase complex subunit B [Austwickia sp. TVS 96-490-7B]